MEKTEQIELINGINRSNLKTAKELFEKTGIPTGRIYKMKREGDIRLKGVPRGQGRLQDNSERNDMIALGFNLGEISRHFGIKRQAVHIYIKYSGQHAKWKKARRMRRRDDLISKGMKIKDIARKCDVTPQAISVYIRESGQMAKWKGKNNYAQIKEKAQDEKRKNRDIGHLIYGVIESKMKTDLEKEAWGRVEEFHRNSEYTEREDLILFEVYKERLRVDSKGEKVSLSHYVKKGLVNFPSEASKILKKGGFKVTDKPWVKNTLTELQKYRIYNSIDSEFTTEDIGSFIGVKSYNVCNEISKFSLRNTKPLVVMGPLGILTYKLASKIYAAVDSGYSKKDVIMATGMSYRAFDFAIRERDEIEDDLIEGLQMMFPEKDIDRPYL